MSGLWRDYRLGLPAWAYAGWRGRYFAARTSPLAGYARVFRTVEGNTTFYRIPDPETVARWQQALEGTDLEICFKLPRNSTHRRQPDGAELNALLDAIRPLGRHVGPLLLQFPETVGPAELERFDAVLAAVRERHRAVLEVRHPAFFDEPERLEPVLQRYALGRVVMDARALHRGDQQHPDVLAALHKKPDLPVLPAVFNDIAFLRLVLHPQIETNGPWLEEWADRIADHLRAGIASYVMIHCPNNQHCPVLAETFHRLLRDRLSGLPPLPDWPVPQQAALL